MNDDLIARNEASLQEMCRDMEAAGYTLQCPEERLRQLEKAGFPLDQSARDALLHRCRLYHALKSPLGAKGEYDEEWEFNSAELSLDVTYCTNDEEEGDCTNDEEEGEGSGYDKQYGFTSLYATKEEQKEVLTLIQQGYGIGVQINSDQDVFVRWSKWRAQLAYFKSVVEWLANRKESNADDAESNADDAE
jgi:hypothetical protein